jgi:hypothetical protein
MAADHLEIARELKKFSDVISDLDKHLLNLGAFELIQKGHKESPGIFEKIDAENRKLYEISHAELIEEHSFLSQLLYTAGLGKYSEYSIFVVARAFLAKKGHLERLNSQFKKLAEEYMKIDLLLKEVENTPVSQGLKQQAATFRAGASEVVKLTMQSETRCKWLLGMFREYYGGNINLLHHLNKRFSFRLDFMNMGRQVQIPVNVIINAAYIDHLFEMRFPGTERFEAISSFMKILSEENVGELEQRILTVLKTALQDALPKVNEQFDLFVGGKEITIVVDLLKESVGEVMTKISQEGGVAHVSYEKGRDDLRFHIDLLYLARVTSGQESFPFLVSTMIHELNHIFDRFSLSLQMISGIRKDGLSILAEFASASKEAIEGRWIQALQIAAEPPPKTEKAVQDRISGDKKYYLGIYMWMCIFIYFARKKLPINVAGCFSNPGVLADTMLSPDIRHMLNIYLRTFRNVNPKRFADLQELAAKSLGLKPYYEML